MECLSGMFSRGGIMECKPCQNGLYSDKEGSGSCSICPQGKFSKESETGIQECTECDSGKYNTKKQSTSCIGCKDDSLCKNGTVVDCSSKTNTICKEYCKIGTATESGHQEYDSSIDKWTCPKCPINTYGENSNITKTTCKPCPDGKYSTKLGATSILSCKSCAGIDITSETYLNYCIKTRVVSDNGVITDSTIESSSSF